MVVGDLTVDGGTLGPRDTRVGDEDVQAAIELLDDVVDLLLDVGLVGNVDLVGLACRPELLSAMRSIKVLTRQRLTLHAILLLDLGGTLDGLLVAVVPDGDVGAGLSETLGDGQTDTGASTGDDGGLALQGEEREDLVLLGGSSVVLRWAEVSSGLRSDMYRTRGGRGGHTREKTPFVMAPSDMVRGIGWDEDNQLKMSAGYLAVAMEMERKMEKKRFKRSGRGVWAGGLLKEGSSDRAGVVALVEWRGSDALASFAAHRWSPGRRTAPITALARSSPTAMT